MKRILFFGSGAALMVALIWSWQVRRMRVETQAAIAELAPQQAAREGEQRAVAASLATVEKQLVELRHSRSPAPAPPAAAPAGTAEKLAAIPPPADTEAVIEKDPKLQVYELAAKRVLLETTYGALLSRLKFTPAERERFLDLMVGRHEVTIDTARAASALGVQASPAVQQLQQQQTEETAQAQRALLGEARFRELQEYERSRVVRTQVVDRLSRALTATELPLTAAQADQLTQVIATASSRYQSGGTANMETVDWDAVVVGAKPVLSGSQLEAFAGLAARQKTFYRMKQYIPAEPAPGR
jgi:hypothetical protein